MTAATHQQTPNAEAQIDARGADALTHERIGGRWPNFGFIVKGALAVWGPIYGCDGMTTPVTLITTRRAIRSALLRGLVDSLREFNLKPARLFDADVRESADTTSSEMDADWRVVEADLDAYRALFHGISPGETAASVPEHDDRVFRNLLALIGPIVSAPICSQPDFGLPFLSTRHLVSTARNWRRAEMLDAVPDDSPNAARLFLGGAAMRIGIGWVRPGKAEWCDLAADIRLFLELTRDGAGTLGAP